MALLGIAPNRGGEGIGKHLNPAGIRTRDGERWGIGAVHKVLTRTTYVGPVCSSWSGLTPLNKNNNFKGRGKMLCVMVEECQRRHWAILKKFLGPRDTPRLFMAGVILRDEIGLVLGALEASKPVS